MDDVKNKIVNRIQDILQESHPNLLITPRIGEVIMMKFIDGSKDSTPEEFLAFLDTDEAISAIQDSYMLDLIESRQPFEDPVPCEVMDNIVNYFKDELSDSGYVPLKVCRKSNHPDDGYLYSVIAKNISSGGFACWSSFNESTQSLNHGHYGLDNEDEARQIISENFYDITDDLCNHGPDKTMTDMPESISPAEEMGGNVIPFRRRR